MAAATLFANGSVPFRRNPIRRNANPNLNPNFGESGFGESGRHLANDVIKELKPLGHNTVAPVNRHSSTNGFGVSRRSNVCSIFTDLVCYFYKYRCNSEQRLGLRLQWVTLLFG